MDEKKKVYAIYGENSEIIDSILELESLLWEKFDKEFNPILETFKSKYNEYYLKDEKIEFIRSQIKQLRSSIISEWILGKDILKTKTDVEVWDNLERWIKSYFSIDKSWINQLFDGYCYGLTDSQNKLRWFFSLIDFGIYLDVDSEDLERWKNEGKEVVIISEKSKMWSTTSERGNVIRDIIYEKNVNFKLLIEYIFYDYLLREYHDSISSENNRNENIKHDSAINKTNPKQIEIRQHIEDCFQRELKPIFKVDTDQQIFIDALAKYFASEGKTEPKLNNIKINNGRKNSLSRILYNILKKYEFETTYKGHHGLFNICQSIENYYPHDEEVFFKRIFS